MPDRKIIVPVWGRSADDIYAVATKSFSTTTERAWSIVDTGVSEYLVRRVGDDTGEVFVVGEGFLRSTGPRGIAVTDVPIDAADGVWGKIRR